VNGGNKEHKGITEMKGIEGIKGIRE